jgi:hypothetical protein
VLLLVRAGDDTTSHWQQSWPSSLGLKRATAAAIENVTTTTTAGERQCQRDAHDRPAHKLKQFPMSKH